MLINRRGLLLGIGATGIFGPSIIKVNHLMPISNIDDWNPYVLAVDIDGWVESVYNYGATNVHHALELALPGTDNHEEFYEVRRMSDVDMRFMKIKYGSIDWPNSVFGQVTCRDKAFYEKA